MASSDTIDDDSSIVVSPPDMNDAIQYHQPIHLLIYISMYQPIYLSIYVYIYLPIPLSIYPSIYLPAHSVFLS
jgi:hypothetical protein